MKKIILLGVVLLLGVVAAVTNPSEERHRAAVREVLSVHAESKLPALLATDSSAVGGSLLRRAVALGLDRAVQHAVTADDYLLFSTTVVTYGAERQVVGVGAFGHVFVSDRLNRWLDQLLG